jgi:hypothetical protein
MKVRGQDRLTMQRILIGRIRKPPLSLSLLVHADNNIWSTPSMIPSRLLSREATCL